MDEGREGFEKGDLESLVLSDKSIIQEQNGGRSQRVKSEALHLCPETAIHFTHVRP